MSTTRLEDAVNAGAACFGVCAGFQLLSQDFTGPDGRLRNGLGLLDAHCGRIDGPRAVGEVLGESDHGVLTGFENHQGDAHLGPAARPLARLVLGVGNGDGLTEGATQGRSSEATCTDRPWSATTDWPTTCCSSWWVRCRPTSTSRSAGCAASDGRSPGSATARRRRLPD